MKMIPLIRRIGSAIFLTGLAAVFLLVINYRAAERKAAKEAQALAHVQAVKVAEDIHLLLPDITIFVSTLADEPISYIAISGPVRAG